MATLRLLDACDVLAPEQLQSRAPGTYGSILETMRHLLGSDSWCLFYVNGDRAHRIDEDQMDLIDVWEYGRQVGRVVEVPPRSLDEEP